jgi:hypothetical protein
VPQGKCGPCCSTLPKGSTASGLRPIRSATSGLVSDDSDLLNG